MKRCKKCDQIKPMEQFHKSKLISDGRENRCKACAHAESAARNERRKALNPRSFAKTPLEYIERHCVPEPNSGCWIWTGTYSKSGYGVANFKRKILRAHRFCWEVFRGAIPDQLCACHKCDNPACVNPDHIFLGTRIDNNADMVKKGRHLVPRRYATGARNGMYTKPHRRRALKGEAHGQAKLTEPQVLEIRRLRASGLTQKAIASRFGISRELVRQIGLRRVWKHLPPDGLWAGLMAEQRG